MSLALCLIFFLSGASALVFETLWFRAAGLTFGNGVWASSLVLASFMAGLALGSLLVARFRLRLKRPLLAYAALEVVIGITGFALVLGLPALASLLAPLFRPLLDEPWLLNPLRLGLAFVLLLVPSTAMGATLPLLVRTLSVREPNFGRALGRLYGWNTLGAVVGALGAEVFLVTTFGVRGAALSAAGLNFLAAFFVLLLARRYPAPKEPSSRESSRFELGGRGRSVLVAASLSGAALLGLEVVWFRFMLLFRNSTSLDFALLLAVVLLGIALGGLGASWWLHFRPDAYRHTSSLALVSGALCLFTYFGFADSMGLLSALPVSAASGLLFTFLGRALKDEVEDETLAAAALTFSNTLGAMTGALAAGFLLLPLLGVERAFLALGVLYGVVAFFARGVSSRRERRVLRLAALGWGSCLLFFPFGLMQNHYLPRVLEPHLADGSRLLAMREGVTESSFYLESQLFGTPRYHRLVTNGFSMSATVYRSKRYMRLFAYWPMALESSPKRGLLISYGVGVTAKALTDQKSFESIDIVDISQDILELSREVDILGEHHPLRDPRVRVHVEDGRYFLQTTPLTFDLITAEPPPPKNAGVVNLYSSEYFDLLHDRLAPEGIATYWLPVYQLRVAEAKAVAKAFCGAFADCSLWTTAGTEWMLAGTRGLAAPVAEAAFGRLWREQPGELRAVGVELPEQMGALFLGDAEFLRSWTANALPLVDDRPHRIRGGLRAQDTGADLAQYLELMNAGSARERFEASAWVRRIWPADLRERTLLYFNYQAVINQHLVGGGAGIPELHRVLSETTLRSLPLMLMASDEEDFLLLEKANAEGVRHPLLQFLLAAHAFGRRDYDSAAAHMARARSQDPASEELARFHVLALLMSSNPEEAARVALGLRRTNDRRDDLFWDWYAATLERARRIGG